MIRFRCPTCQKKLKAPPEAAGKGIKCPRCKAILEVPQGEGKTVPTSEAAWSPEMKAPAVREQVSDAPLPSVLEADDSDELEYTAAPPARDFKRMEVHQSSRRGCDFATAIMVVSGQLIVGWLILLIYFFYDTTTMGPNGSVIHNEGLMNNRIVGMLFGLGWILSSMVSLLFDMAWRGH